MLIQGKDWALEVDEPTLVRMAVSVLRENDEKLTVHAVAEIAGLSVADVVATMRTMVAAIEPEK